MTSRIYAGIWIFLMAGLFVSCNTNKSPRAYNDSGMMYAMIYDYDNLPVTGVNVLINGKKTVDSDIQGRFILDIAKPGEYTITLTKNGYEPIEEDFIYDPMNVLYFKMINASQLLVFAEDAIDQHAYESAESYLNRAVLLEPYRSDVLYLKSILYYVQNRYPEAKEQLDYMISLGIRDEYVKKLLDRVSR